MKKWMGVLLAFVCFLLSGISAKADVIWEPMQGADTFYDEHSGECEYEDRVYIANGPDGCVILYESPESAKEITTWENGDTGYIGYTYTDKDGNVWGMYNNGDAGESGWMPMAYMKPVYDTVAFLEEFGDLLVEEEGKLEAEAGTQVYFWEYPGAEDYTEMPVYDDAPGYYKVFVDEAGHRWGMVSYYYGMKASWICLDAPSSNAEELYPEGLPKRSVEEESESAQDYTEEKRIIPQSRSDSQVGVIVLIVAAVVAVTAVLLILLKRKR